MNMRVNSNRFQSWVRAGLIAVALLVTLSSSYAGLFEDDEARKAILDLRTRVDQNRQAEDAQNTELNQSLQNANAALRRSMLELQNQIEALRADLARMRGQDEQLARDLAEFQRRQKDMTQAFDERVRRLEPAKVQLDGREFMAEPAEQRDYNLAFELFRKSDFQGSATAFADFLRRYAQTGYRASALFWLGNAEYATRDYKEASAHFRALIALAPDHPKTPEAALGLANSQIELKETRAARKTLEDLIKTFPQSDAAVAAKDRLSKLR